VQSRYASAGDSFVLFAGATAHADGPDDHAIAKQWHAPGVDRDTATMGTVNAEERPAGLAVPGQFGGAHVEGSSRKCLVDCYLDCANACTIHTDVRDKMASRVDHRDVHREVDPLGFGLRRCENLTGVIQIDHERNSFAGYWKLLSTDALRRA